MFNYKKVKRLEDRIELLQKTIEEYLTVAEPQLYRSYFSLPSQSLVFRTNRLKREQEEKLQAEKLRLSTIKILNDLGILKTIPAEEIDGCKYHSAAE